MLKEMGIVLCTGKSDVLTLQPLSVPHPLCIFKGISN